MGRRLHGGEDTARERRAMVACGALHRPPAVDLGDFEIPHIREALARNVAVRRRKEELERRGMAWTEILPVLTAFRDDFPTPIFDALLRAAV